MTLRYRILGVVSMLVTLALVSLALALSHDSPCGAPDSLPDDTQRMKAVVHRCYGSAEVLEVEEIGKPTPADDQVLVKVHAAALNPLDNVGNHSFSDLRRMLQPNGILVLVGGPKHDLWIGPLANIIKASALSPFVGQELVTLLAEPNQADLDVLSGLIQAGQVTPVIDRRYPLSEVPTAIQYLEQGRARGKIVVNL